MSALQRLTTQYIECEDRIRLTGEVEAGEGSRRSVVLWLTRRLMDRLLPPLFDWLSQQGVTAPRSEVLQSFAQEAARASLAPQPPVEAGPESSAWRVERIDLTRTGEGVYLVFRGGEAQVAELMLTPQALRQWLSIVQDQYRQGEWSTKGWPEWMEEAQRPPPSGAARLH